MPSTPGAFGGAGQARLADVLGGPGRAGRTQRIRSTSCSATDERPEVRAESVFDLSEQPKQVAAQLATVVIREPDRARPIERLSDGIPGRNHV
jgi:hypothetical protein